MNAGYSSDGHTGEPTRAAVRVDDGTPRVLQTLAGWSWRVLAVTAAVLTVAITLRFFSEITIAVSIALLAAAMLHPVIRWATGKGVPKGASVAVTVMFALCAVVGFIALVGNSIVAGVPQLASATTRSLDASQRWLVDGPLHLDERQLGNLGNDLAALVRDNESTITRGALLTVASLGELVTVGLLAVFTLIFILYDGSGIWRFLTSGIRGPARDKTRAAGSAGFSTLTSYVHATTIVAIIDAVGIGVGLLILGVPLAFPLAGLVFVGAFIPIVGALLAGSLAVGVTLVTQGWTSALIALAIVIVVMQFESHVLQPFLLGRSVRLHPLAVVLGIAAGTVTAGIIGGILAVPLIAFCNTAIRSLRACDDEKNHATTEPDTDHTDTWDTGADTGDITPEDGEN